MHNLYKDIENTMIAIEEKWQKHNYDTDLFPEIVWDKTSNIDFSPLGEVSNQLKLFELPGIRYQQKQSTFSDLYIQIFHNGRFMIEILNWWGGHVNVHDHDFSAVQFQLKGDSLNATYDFNETTRIGALRFGELKVNRSEIWKEGGKSIVRPGDQDPHSVFHIGDPTTSMLIRTIATPRYGAQSNYFPTLAAHYYVANDIQRKKLTGLSLLSRSNKDEFKKHINNFLNTQSLSENFFMLLKLGNTLFQEKYMDILSTYADRGEMEGKIIKNVAMSNGIEFFKTKANETNDLSYNEKLVAFKVAASHSEDNFRKITSQLNLATNQEAKRHLLSFIEKLDSEDQEIATQYLHLFGLGSFANEKI